MNKQKYAKRMKRMESKEMKEILELADVPGLISFAGGLPAPELFPIEALKASANEVLDSVGRKALQYNDPVGYGPLREWVAKRMETFDVSVEAKDILITSGSQQGLDFAGKVFLDKGDIVLCESPSYLGAINALAAYECDFLEVPTDDDGMIIEELEKIAASNDKIKLVYVIPEFQNPTGKTWSDKRREEFMEVIEKYGLIVLEDNPYGELRYGGESRKSLKSMDKSDRVVYLGTFSKILSPGIRIGWVCAGEETMDMFVKVKQRSDVHTNSVSQMEVANFLENNDIDEHISKIKELYRKRRNIMLETIDACFPAGIETTRPDGGLFLWVVLPEKIDSKEMLKKAVEKNVGYVPGGTFFPNGSNKNTMRLSFSNMEEEKIVQGIKILAEVIKKEI